MEFLSLSFWKSFLSNPSWDLVFIFSLIAVMFFYGISKGKSKIVLLMFSLYITGFLFNNFHYIDSLTVGETIMEALLFKLFIFFMMVIILNTFFARFFELQMDSGEKNWWQILLLSTFLSCLLFVYIFQLFGVEEIFSFSPIMLSLFAPQELFFWWLVAPLVTLVIVRR